MINKSKEEVNKILDILEEIYPEAQCELNYNNPFELLIATMLSAQTTDKKVNEVTKILFKKYPTPQEFLKANKEELEQDIKVIGLYRNKSKNIINMCKVLVEQYNCQVPNNKEELMKLAGVGRKTANVVLSNAFNVPAIAVDTHVFRVSNRIGLANGDNVLKTEKQLQSVIPKERWSKAHHLIIFHGRRACKARKPNCKECILKEYCNYYKENIIQ
ncbi:endonuclease III [Clostridium aestuarii]|uniref:Endonuclease III n=1 Tax=Clostridium aestuarii TaxID=338193 RepID=A0ABT4CW16_9CLOT|nr:endonuclease III [Clostridium aestuarii]MCY6483174.1 endonuclease III [Clostridium aestuarii]